MSQKKNSKFQILNSKCFGGNFGDFFFSEKKILQQNIPF
jgi:hypothetical protein